MSNTPMTPTPEGKQLAADLANAERVSRKRDADWTTAHFGGYCDDACAALARLATEHLALKAKHEEALADLREIDRLAVLGKYPLGSIPHQIGCIAAKWRVETDPLLEALQALEPGWKRSSEYVEKLRAELSKRGYEIGRKS